MNLSFDEFWISVQNKASHNCLANEDRSHFPYELKTEYVRYLLKNAFENISEEKRRTLEKEFNDLKLLAYQAALKGEALRLNCKVSEVRPTLYPVLPLTPEDNKESALLSLPYDIFIKIMNRLDTIDTFRLTLVCKKWRSAVYDNFDNSDETVKLPNLEVCCYSFRSDHHSLRIQDDILVSSNCLRAFRGCLYSNEIKFIDKHQPLENIFGNLIALDLIHFTTEVLEALIKVDTLQLKYLRLEECIVQYSRHMRRKARSTFDQLLPKLKQLEIFIGIEDLGVTNTTINLIADLCVDLHIAVLYEPKSLSSSSDDGDSLIEEEILFDSETLSALSAMVSRRNPDLDLSKIHIVLDCDEAGMKNYCDADLGFSLLIYHLESYHQVKAALSNYLLARRVKAAGFKVLLSGEGADEALGGYLYFYKAPNKAELRKETIRKTLRLHYWDVLRANKASYTWGVKVRAPFLDFDDIMNIDPIHKMCALTQMMCIQEWRRWLIPFILFLLVYIEKDIREDYNTMSPEERSAAFLAYIANTGSLIFMVPFIVKEFNAVVYYRWQWIEMWNVVGVFAFILQILIGIFHFSHFLFDGRLFTSMLAVQCVLLFMKVQYYFRVIEVGGAYLESLKALVISVRGFLLFIVLTVISASLAFASLYKWDTEQHTSLSLKEELDGFSSFPRSVVATFAVLLGNFEPSYIYHTKNRVVKGFFFVIFMTVMSIAVLNLLIAVMTQSYASVNQDLPVLFEICV
eukprot:g7285.t1